MENKILILQTEDHGKTGLGNLIARTPFRIEEYTQGCIVPEQIGIWVVSPRIPCHGSSNWENDSGGEFMGQDVSKAKSSKIRQSTEKSQSYAVTLDLFFHDR